MMRRLCHSCLQSDRRQSVNNTTELLGNSIEVRAPVEVKNGAPGAVYRSAWMLMMLAYADYHLEAEERSAT